MVTPLLQTRKICKSFPGVQALMDVDLTVEPGEVHILLGENGAGKSTLIKLLSGVFAPDRGVILYQGQEVQFTSPRDAQRLGIGVLYQEPNLISHLTVAENIHLGSEPGSASLPAIIDDDQLVATTLALFDDLNLALDPYALVAELTLAEQQMVAVARALHLSAGLVIMDEPTSMLSHPEVSQLFSVIRRLRARGISILYVTHRLEEALQIGDHATVLRDGQKVATIEVNTATQADLIRMIAGHGIEEPIIRPAAPLGPEVLRLENISSPNGIQNVSFSLHAGEILGITGLIGAGGTNLLRTLFGVEPLSTGALFLDGNPVKIRSPQEAIALGIGLLTEDSHAQGLVLEMNAQENITLASLDGLTVGPVINHQAENNVGEHYARRMKFPPSLLSRKTLFLSGGSQQKVVLSRWLASQCRVLLLDEPTRGVDVGTRAEVYRLLNDLTRRGLAVIMVSSNLSEILSLSDSIAILRRGQVTAFLPRSEANPSKVLTLASGGLLP